MSAYKQYTLSLAEEPDYWTMYRTAESQFWTAEQYLLPHKKTSTMQYTTSMNFGPMESFLADLVVYHDANILGRLSQLCSPSGAIKPFLSHQAAMRRIHVAAYLNVIRYIAGTQTRFDAILKAAKKRTLRSAWVEAAMCENNEFQTILATVLCAECIFFSAQPNIIAATQYVSSRLPDNVHQIFRKVRSDKTLTVELLVNMHQEAIDDSSTAHITRMIAQAVKIENNAIEDMDIDESIYPGVHNSKFYVQLAALDFKSLMENWQHIHFEQNP
ncbi:hypothetical protein C8R43DRAFT_956103 [Mycena crocata]|nr:hypothetical protein C8R43DRAFT_956103 [Mycena crocata]